MTIRDPLIGRALGGYRVEDPIGAGAFARVYLASDRGTGRAVAVKVLHREWRLDIDVIERFEREAKLCARVRHPNVVELIDYGEHDGIPFLVMELIRGRGLRSVVDPVEPSRSDRVLDLMEQILRGLAAVHDAGIVHCDLKPENILVVDEVDGGERVKLVDFGVASPATKEGVPAQIAGTPDYMAPELVSEGFSAASDVYAAGVLLYELLTGRLPFDGDSPMAIIEAHRARVVERPPEIEPRYWAVIERALDKRPGCRYPDARAMADALAQARRTTRRPCRSRRQSTKSRLRALRRAIGEALRAGEAALAGERYLELAAALVTLGMSKRAIAELREAIVVVTAGEGGHGDAGPPVTARLLCRLARLEGEAGERARARSHARAALRRALLCGDRPAEIEARELVTGRRMASRDARRRRAASETAPI